MTKQIVLFAIGFALIVASKYFCRGVMWTQTQIFRVDPGFSEFSYRLSAIFVGLVFVLLSLL